MSNGIGDFGVSRLGTATKIDQRVPYLELKVRASDIHFERRVTLASPDLSRHLQCVLIVLLERCIGPPVLQLLQGGLFLSRFHKREMANPAPRSRYQCMAERCIGETVADQGASA